MCDCFPQDYRRPAVWVASMRGNVPPHAVCGGEVFGTIFYVARVNHFGEVIVGKLVPIKGCVYIGWKGEEFAYYEYEVLCNPENVQHCWQWNTDCEIPSGALQAGRTREGEPLYIGRKWQNGSLSVGSVVPSKKCLYVAFFGKVYAACDFEVLTCKSINL